MWEGMKRERDLPLLEHHTSQKMVPGLSGTCRVLSDGPKRKQQYPDLRKFLACVTGHYLLSWLHIS